MPGTLMLRAKFDSAQTTPDNRRHWSNADHLSADAAASPKVRETLRNRARYEVANNSYARGIVLTLANDVIGTGPRLQILSDDGEADRHIESEFAAWAKAVDLPGKLRTMREARAQDGEVFAVLFSNENLDSPVKLDLRLIEADQVTTPDLRAAKKTAVDGIVLDEFGNPTEYHVLKQHPGGQATLGMKYDRVKHWSLTTLREKLIKIGAKVVTHSRYVIFQMAEVAVPKRLFRAILERTCLPQAGTTVATAGDGAGMTARTVETAGEGGGAPPKADADRQ